MFEIVYGDVATLTNFCMNTFVNMAYIIASFIVVSLYLLFLRWDMFLVIIILDPILLIGQCLISPKVKRQSENYRSGVGEVVNSMQEMFTNPIDIKMSGLQEGLVKRIQKLLLSSFVCGRKLTWIGMVILSIVSHMKERKLAQQE